MNMYIKKIVSLAIIASTILSTNNVTVYGETTKDATNEQGIAEQQSNQNEQTQQPVQTPSETKAVSSISLPDNVAYWSTFGGNNTGNGTIDSKTPSSLKDMVAKSKIIPNQFFEPILVGNYLYSITDCAYLTKYDSDGNEIARTSLGATLTSWVSARMSYGDGKIFVAVNGRIKAYDATTLQPLWQSVDTGKQINGALTYYNGYLYAGITDGSFNNPKGYFFALKTSDDMITSTNEEKAFVWKTEENKGYYWSSGVITNNAIVFVGDDGNLISHHLTRDISFDTYHLGDSANVRNNLLYIAEDESVLVPTQNSKQLFKIGINSDGTFQRKQVQSLQLDAQLSGGIAYYNGRIYASSGGMSGTYLQVIDAQSMQVIYKTSVNTQSYPLITTAYATAANNYKVYIYVIDFKGGIVKLEDAQGQTSEIKEEITKDFLSWNSNSIVGDINGNLFVYNGYDNAKGNRITIYSNPNSAYTAIDVDNAVARIDSGKAKVALSYNDIQQIDYIQLRYQALPESEKQNVIQKSKLDSLVVEGKQINATLITNLNNAIAAIHDDISASDIVTLEALWNTYGFLSDEDKNKIIDFKKLENSLVKAYEIQSGVAQLIKDIDGLKDVDQITLSDKAEVFRLKSLYEKLSDADKSSVTNVSKLDKAINQIKYLVDLTYVDEMVDSISALPSEVTLKNEKAINTLYKTYSDLHKDVKKKITNANKLDSLYEAITKQRADVDELNDNIWNKLNPRDITLKDEALVNQIMKQYASLHDVNKTYVKNYDDVIMANTIITSLHKGIIPSIVFKNIKDSDITYVYEGNMETYVYQISFIGTNIKKVMDVNVGFKSTSEYDSLIKKEYANAFIMNMEHVGALPGMASITIDIPSKNGTYGLYRFDTTKKVSSKVSDVNLQDGKVSFTITEGGIYFVALTSEIAKPVDTSDTTNQNTQTLFVIMMISAVVFSIYYRRKKKEVI